MTTKLTLFTATLVQDSALSVSGLDRETSADQPFALVDGVPTLVGRGLKGAAVAMAKRFFDPLPRAVSDDIEATAALRRSAWEFADATTNAVPRVRAGSRHSPQDRRARRRRALRPRGHPGGHEVAAQLPRRLVADPGGSA